jgi:MFS family permease
MQSASSARASSTGVPATTASVNRWVMLIIGIVCMVMIANLQYGWTLFVHPMNAAHGWSIADIQIAFSIFVALETWLTPIEGWIVDQIGPKNGPKSMIAFGGVCVAAAWIINSFASTLTMLYIGAALSGIGAGAVYATCVGNAVKWFPDHRGFAVGLTAAGFGAGAALTVIPIRAVIAAQGYATAFFWFGLIQGVIVFILAWFLRAPFAGETPVIEQPRVLQTTESYSPQRMLVTPVFWVMYIMFLLVAASGLMATAQRRQRARPPPVRVGLRSHRPRVHYGARLRSRRHQLLVVGIGRYDAVGVCDIRRTDLPDLGRDLQPVPVDLHRQFRPQIRHDQSEPSLHGQGSCRIPRPTG